MIPLGPDPNGIFSSEVDPIPETALQVFSLSDRLSSLNDKIFNIHSIHPFGYLNLIGKLQFQCAIVSDGTKFFGYFGYTELYS